MKECGAVASVIVMALAAIVGFLRVAASAARWRARSCLL